MGAVAAPAAAGDIDGTDHLRDGEHPIQPQVEDTSGKTGTASVIVGAGTPSSAPTGASSSPEDGQAAPRAWARPLKVARRSGQD